MNHDRHIQLIAWLHVIVGVLSLVFLFFIFIAGSAFGIVVGVATDNDAAPAVAIYSFMFLFFMFYLLVGSLPTLLIGWGLLTRKSWARYIAIGLAVLGLLNFPIGTALSVYTIWALWSNDANEYFRRRYLTTYEYARY